MNLATENRPPRRDVPWSRKLHEARVASAPLEALVEEPYLTEFMRLVREGAGTLDIPEASVETCYTRPIAAYDALVEREVRRVVLHRESLNKLLERFVGSAERILDVGCGTGATTAAMALSEVIGAREIVGVDPNEHSLAAARVRARGHGLTEPRVRFQAIAPRPPLPFDDGSYDLTVCVSVIEYLPTHEERRRFAADLVRVTRPGGHVLLITPNPLRLRDYHTGRFFGDWRREGGFPWASPPWDLAKLLPDCDLLDVRAYQIENGLRRLGLSLRVPPRWAFVGHALPWQKILVRKRAS